MTLCETLDRLTSDFARQVIAALRNASLDELAARAPAAAPAAQPRRGATARVAVARGPRTARAEKVAAALPQSVTTPETRSAALRVLEHRGSRGATASQLEAELSLQGFATASDLMQSLVESGLVKDSGFRRASGGNATSPVYVAVDVRNGAPRSE